MRPDVAFVLATSSIRWARTVNDRVGVLIALGRKKILGNMGNTMPPVDLFEYVVFAGLWTSCFTKTPELVCELDMASRIQTNGGF